MIRQYDDWLHRGDDPCVRNLSLYLYSMWVYREERTVRTDPETLLIPFAKSYILHGTYYQRLATEPRDGPFLGTFFDPPKGHKTK